jgi:paraquat-inducible protein B
VRYDLANTLQEMTKTAKSLRTLADYLERHPEALLSGKRRDADR